jgi:hypothetical protein
MLTEKEVREIKRLLKEGKLSQKQMGEKYQHEPGNVSRIGSGKLWKSVKYFFYTFYPTAFFRPELEEKKLSCRTGIVIR